MKTTMDNAGRIVIPKEIRKLARLSPGTTLAVRVRDGVIELEPAPLAVRMIEKDGFTVAHPVTEQPKLTRRTVNETIESVRSRR